MGQHREGEISQHIVFDEAQFPFSASPHLTNDLDILLHLDSLGATPMTAPLLVQHVPLGFPPLATTGGPTTRAGSPIAPRT
jgi:hypothetical protein